MVNQCMCVDCKIGNTPVVITSCTTTTINMSPTTVLSRDVDSDTLREVIGTPLTLKEKST